MAEETINDEYAQIVLESRRRGEISELPEGEERREFPRLGIDASDLWIDSVAHFTVANISSSGIALVCNHPVEIGTQLNFSSEANKSVPAKVVACELEESPTEFLDAQYRVHCEFGSVEAGMEFVVGRKRKKNQA